VRECEPPLVHLYRLGLRRAYAVTIDFFTNRILKTGVLTCRVVYSCVSMWVELDRNFFINKRFFKIQLLLFLFKLQVFKLISQRADEPTTTQFGSGALHCAGLYRRESRGLTAQRASVFRFETLFTVYITHVYYL
jgi:hypothetical protein